MNNTETKSLVSTPAAYVAVPTDAGPFPGMLVLSEAWGLNAEVERLTTALAEQGYLAVAPDLLLGRKPRAAVADTWRGVGPTVLQVEVVHRWLASDWRCADGRVGVLGVSMGATLALRFAARGRFRVAAAFYGYTPKVADWTSACPIVASYGGRDRVVRDRGRRLAEALANRQIPADVRWYPTAGHSFLTTTDPGWQSAMLGLRHEPRAAAHAWQRTIEFLKTHL